MLDIWSIGGILGGKDPRNEMNENKVKTRRISKRGSSVATQL